MSNVKDTQSRKWMLVINNPEDHGLTKDKIIELLNLFHPDYFCLAAEISPGLIISISSCTPLLLFGSVRSRIGFLPPISNRQKEAAFRIGNMSVKTESGKAPIRLIPVWKVRSRSLD